MSIKEQVAADWNQWHFKRGFPRSWYANDTNELPLVLAESYAAGCITTYLQLEEGEKLDEERVQYLIGCREVFLKARPLTTDEEGEWLLALYLRMSKMVLADCGVGTNDDSQLSHHANTSANG